MKLTSSPARRAAVTSLAAAAVISVTGCSAINYQATTHQYSGSDGMRAEVGDVKFRHMAFVAGEGDGPARAIGSVNNGGSEEVQVEFTVDEEEYSVAIPAGEAVSLEHDEEFVVEEFSGSPGSVQRIGVSVDGESQEIDATVLDGVLAEYRDLVPGGHDESVTDHLVHGPDTWGSGAAHHDDGDDGH